MDERIYLNVPFAEKDIAKSLGAMFDYNGCKKWYCYEWNKDKFERWLPFSTMTYNDLSDEQKFSIDRAKSGKNILVDACIGSGKTTTIQVMCNELKDKQILYLTYNRLLKKDAQAKIISPNTLATNYDGFAYMCLKNGNYPTDVERNIRFFNKYEPDTNSYDLLILDEYQDIKEDVAEMLKILKERNPKMQIIAVGDMQQKIYNFTTLNIKGFIQEFLGDHEQLNFTRCFRLSKEHAEHLGMLWGKNIVGVNENNKTVIMHDIHNIVDFLVDKEPKDILVLGSRTGDVATVLNMLESDYPDKFNKNTVYASIREEDKGNADRNDVAIFTTFDSAKGLERKYCICLDWTKEYYSARKIQPDADYETLKNLFLVGASRGKEMNIFYDNPYGSRDWDDNSKARNLLSNLYYGKDIYDIPMGSRFMEDEILLEPFDKPYTHNSPFRASDMFDFLYAEDVAMCSSLIKTKKIKTDLEKINVNTQDGNIDLSPCIGIFTEANFFKDYNLDKDKEMILLDPTIDIIKPRMIFDKINNNGEKLYKPLHWNNKDATVEDKILMLIGTQTHQDRYCWQVEVPFVKPEEKKLIEDRLRTRFDGTEQIQSTLEIDFNAIKKNVEESETFQIHGICDVVKDDIIWELKFTDELKETHYLQLAFYLCADPTKRGVLWNVKTNEMYEVEVPDKKKFVSQMVKAISKRNLKAIDYSCYEMNNTRFDNDEIKRNKNAKVKNQSKQVETDYFYER